jgi:hypothetical protein
MTGATNTLTASLIKTATTEVSVSGATAPSSGQALIATSTTTATWQNIALPDISVKAIQNATQTITNNSAVAIQFQSEEFDTDVMHDNSTNNTRITIKTAGKFLI